jgi:hypothetical protein
VRETPTRDDPAYWETNKHSDDHPQPADHNEAGFFVTSPEERTQPLAELVGDRLSRWTPESPMTARARTQSDRGQRLVVVQRMLAFAQAIRGEDGPHVRRGPTRWNRRAA